jgi:hypothetical protein
VNEPETPFEPRPSYVELHAYACAMRPDWDRRDLQDAMTAVIQAGWPYREIHREVMRLAWAEGETPAVLRNSARRPGSTPVSLALDPDVKAALFGQLAEVTQAIRSGTRTGGQPVLNDTSDRQETTR